MKSSPLPPVLLSGFRSQSCLILALSLRSLCELGTVVHTAAGHGGGGGQGLHEVTHGCLAQGVARWEACVSPQGPASRAAGTVFSSLPASTGLIGGWTSFTLILERRPLGLRGVSTLPKSHSQGIIVDDLNPGLTHSRAHTQ